MPKSRTEPTYQLHKGSGQARTIIDGKSIYLGKYNSVESQERFNEIKSEWRLRNNVDQSTLTIDDLAIRFMAHAADYYRAKDGSSTGTAENIKYALRPLVRVHGSTRVNEFGPKKLKAVRDEMIQAGHSRTYINGSIGKIKQAYLGRVFVFTLNLCQNWDCQESFQIEQDADMTIDFAMTFPCYCPIDENENPRTFSAADDEKIQAVAVFTDGDLCTRFAMLFAKKGPHGRIEFSDAFDLADYLELQSRCFAKGHPISTVVVDPGDPQKAAQSFPILEFANHVRDTADRSSPGALKNAPIQEQFSQSRMERCGRICHLIMENWRKKNSFEYIIRATESVHGKSLDELQGTYFTGYDGPRKLDSEICSVLGTDLVEGRGWERRESVIVQRSRRRLHWPH